MCGCWHMARNHTVDGKDERLSLLKDSEYFFLEGKNSHSWEFFWMVLCSEMSVNETRLRPILKSRNYK